LTPEPPIILPAGKYWLGLNLSSDYMWHQYNTFRWEITSPGFGEPSFSSATTETGPFGPWSINLNDIVGSQLAFSLFGNPVEDSPVELANKLMNTILSLTLAGPVENSYMANLKKVSQFLETGKTIPAVNQLNAFIQKIKADIRQGKIDPEDGNYLITQANLIISMTK
jgi:hypothetical protein